MNVANVHDIDYMALYKGSKTVFTKYIKTNSYTCKSLKAATAYTVKVTSYVESKGTKLYAASETSLKAATAPEKAKLSSVKKKSSSKAKITWKKTAGADGYEVFMRTGKGSFKKIKTITKGKTTSFTDIFSKTCLCILSPALAIIYFTPAS